MSWLGGVLVAVAVALGAYVHRRHHPRPQDVDLSHWARTEFMRRQENGTGRRAP